MADAMESLTAKLRANGSAANMRDVTTVSSAGRSMVLFLNASVAAADRLESAEGAAAQRALSRAGASHNTVRDAADRIESPEIKRRVESAADSSNQVLNSLLERQRGQYRDRLDVENPTALQAAQNYRRLAQLALLAGDDAQARTLQNRSQAAFEEYASLVREGNQHLQTARRGRDNLTSTALLSFGGQRVYWIGRLDAVAERRQVIEENYGTAAARFERAGAESRAETANAEREQFVQTMDTAGTLSMVGGALLGLGFLVVIAFETRAVYHYIKDSGAAVSGDFLVPHETSS
jgi:hypothetical protein